MTQTNPETIRTVEAGYRAGQAVDNPWKTGLTTGLHRLTHRFYPACRGRDMPARRFRPGGRL
ncbi:MAG: hypothetical protein OXG56_12460, partial [Gammaproteobacteria bacterium]|nr:hypothetical protein [Gammaproteobacteria bacterium]